MSAPDLLDFGGPQQVADDTTFSSEGFHFAAEGVGSGQESGQQPHPAAGTSVSTAPRTPGPGMEPPAVPPARVPPLPGPASGAAPAPRKAQQAATRRREQGRGGAGITGGEHALTAKRRRVEAGSGVGPRGEHLRGSEAAPPSPSNGDPASMARAVAAETHTLDVGAATLESSLREWAERSREQLAALKLTSLHAVASSLATVGELAAVEEEVAARCRALEEAAATLNVAGHLEGLDQTSVALRADTDNLSKQIAELSGALAEWDVEESGREAGGE